VIRDGQGLEVCCVVEERDSLLVLELENQFFPLHVRPLLLTLRTVPCLNFLGDQFPEGVVLWKKKKKISGRRGRGQR